MEKKRRKKRKMIQLEINERRCLTVFSTLQLLSNCFRYYWRGIIMFIWKIYQIIHIAHTFPSWNECVSFILRWKWMVIIWCVRAFSVAPYTVNMREKFSAWHFVYNLGHNVSTYAFPRSWMRRNFINYLLNGWKSIK